MCMNALASGGGEKVWGGGGKARPLLVPELRWEQVTSITVP